MKKLFITTVIIIGLLNTSNAQNTNFGIKAGLNVSDLTGSSVNTNSLLNFHAGLFLELELSEKFLLQPELLYSKQGTEVENKTKVKVDYLSIPLILKYRLLDNFSIEAGPQVAFLVNDKIEYNDDTIPDAEADANSFDFGLNLGLAYDFSDNMFTQLRYNFGITPVSENPDITNGVLQISLGYRLKKPR